MTMDRRALAAIVCYALATLAALAAIPAPNGFPLLLAAVALALAGAAIAEGGDDGTR